MIEKLPFTEIHTGGEDMVDRVEFRPVAPYEMQHKINELVDAVNELQGHIKFLDERIRTKNFMVDVEKNNPVSKTEKCETPAENVQPDYVTTTYMTNGHIKEYYGQNGASIVTDHPLPAGYVITIREPETKGGDNE